MPAYVIVEVNVNDLIQYEVYKELTPSSIKTYNGKFIARGAKSETLEGDWHPERIVVLELPSTADAKSWWNSKEYEPAKSIRHRSADTKMILIEGYQ